MVNNNLYIVPQPIPEPSARKRRKGSPLDTPLHCSLLTTHCSLFPVPILWQGSGIIVFNKPQGLSTHGPQSLDTIVNTWLAEGGTGPLPRSLSFRPGPLHRLDKPTSGAIAFSQTLEGAKLFSSLLREHKLEKIYIAIVEGVIEKDKGTGNREQGTGYSENIWRDTLEHNKDVRKTFIKTLRPPLRLKPSRDIRHTGAFSWAPALPHKSKNTAMPCTLGVPTPDSQLPTPKEAVTIVRPLASNGKYSLIEARIKTGRHHQIRAQAASHGHPLAGDIKYGARAMPDQSHGGSYFLHAWKIRFTECPDGLPREIIAPLPEAFQARIKELFGKRGLKLS